MKRPLLLLFLILGTFYSCTNDGPGDGKGRSQLPVLSAENKQREEFLISELDQLKRDRCMEGATMGYLFLDCSGKEPRVIAQQDPVRPLIPASTLKIFVTGAALDIFGPPIIPEITVTNLESINWRSSRIMRKIGGTVFQKSTNAAGARAVIEFWKAKGVDTRGMYLDDGNGLSRNNAISPRQLVDALFAVQRSPYFRYFYESLPLSGLTGTLKRAMKGTTAQGRIRAKTGTIAGVKSFAGYAHTISGKKVIFAIIVNGFYCRPKVVKKKLEAVLVRMAEI